MCVCVFCTHLEKKESGTQVRVCLEVLNLETQTRQSCQFSGINNALRIMSECLTPQEKSESLGHRI